MGEGQPADNPIVWQPHPGPQTRLLKCPCFEVFYGGARGGGKTDGMLGEFIAHAFKYASAAIGLMVRRTRTELVETIERSRQLYLPLGCKYNETDKMWRFPNGARLRFAYLERDSDADAYQGHSYTRVYVEEAGTFPSEKPILKLMATLRSGTGVPVGIRLTGNPGGPGQQWVKARYIDPCPTGWQVQHRKFINPFNNEELSKDWVFIPSKVYDNPSLDPNAYIANLQMSGGPQLVKAWLEGDFGAIEGAFFDNWSMQRHVIPPFPLAKDWLRFRSMDWGSASPFSIGWYCVIGDDTSNRLTEADGSQRTITLPRGALVKYREWYGASSPGVGLKLSNSEIAAGIIERELNDPKLGFGVADPSMFKHDGGPSIAEQINLALLAKKLISFREADNKRVPKEGAISGWAQMRDRLTGNEDGHPMLAFFDNCRDSIRTIPTLQHDPDKLEDLDTKAEDHAADEVRYACMSRPWTRRIQIPAVKKPKDYIVKLDTVQPGEWRAY